MKKQLTLWEPESVASDEWYTFPKTVECLLPYIPKKYKNILCPFSWENSSFVKVLSEAGYNVTFSHKTKDNKKSFFEYTKSDLKNIDCIIDNPPYSMRNQIIEQLFEWDIPFILFIPWITLTKSFVRKRILEFNFILFPQRQKFYNSVGKYQGSPYDVAYFMWLKEEQHTQQIFLVDYERDGRW